MSPSVPDVDWDAAIDLAAGLGCDPEEDCWQRCIDDAYERIKGMQ